MALFRRNQQPTIDLTEPTEDDVETVRRVRAITPGGQITFGAPTRCPACSTYGYVEQVDRANGHVHNRCTACQTTWRINRRALVEAPVAATIVRPVGNGILVRGLALSA